MKKILTIVLLLIASSVAADGYRSHNRPPRPTNPPAYARNAPRPYHSHSMHGKDWITLLGAYAIVRAAAPVVIQNQPVVYYEPGGYWEIRQERYYVPEQRTIGYDDNGYEIITIRPAHYAYREIKVWIEH